MDETVKHIRQVGTEIDKVISHLTSRIILHDKSKLESPEKKFLKKLHLYYLL